LPSALLLQSDSRLAITRIAARPVTILSVRGGQEGRNPAVKFFDRQSAVTYILGGWRYRPASLAVRRMDALEALLCRRTPSFAE
jgi:hypothetical protein